MAPAVDAVLSIYELFENIIVHLPAVDITVVMRVSRAWKGIFDKSKTLHDARILAPVGNVSKAFGDGIEKLDMLRDGFITERVWKSHLEVPPELKGRRTPLYDINAGIKCHRALTYSALERAANVHILQNPSVVRASIRSAEIFTHSAGPNLREIEDAYATIPPCQAIASRITRDCGVVVYAKNGVRIRDLREAYDGMMEALGPRSVGPRSLFRRSFAYFDVVRRGNE